MTFRVASVEIVVTLSRYLRYLEASCFIRLVAFRCQLVIKNITNIIRFNAK